MKAGESFELAIWMTGTEIPHHIVHWKEFVVTAAVEDCERTFGVEIGPLVFSEKYPGEPRVPPVPDHIQGPDVRLLVAEAKVQKVVGIRPAPGFVHDLTEDDLEKLREMVRRQYAAKWRGVRLTNQQCDTVIESLGPVVVDKIIRKKVDYHHA